MDNKYSKFVICDNEKCIGCKKCEKACSEFHIGVYRTIVPRIKVNIIDEEKFNVVTCMHCENAPCMEACPNNNIKRINNQIYIDEINCEGCEKCASACPIGAISMMPYVKNGEAQKKKGNRIRLIATKCDMCVGSNDGYKCINSCESNALKLIDLG